MNTREIDYTKIGIIGGGFVGNILKRAYPNAKIYDKYKEMDSLHDVLSQNVIFIAFNLEDNAASDDSFEQILQYPNEARPSGKVFIIKSTFIPGTTDKLQHENPSHYFLYNPEFLTEATAWEDFIKPQFQILGCTHQSLDIAMDVFKILPDAPYKTIISPKDAETLKHAINSYYAMKVVWFNQLYDACKELGSDYDTIRELMVKNEWIGDSHSKIYFQGYRGYGGKCILKDTCNFSKIVKFPLLDHLEKYNEALRNMQK